MSLPHARPLDVINVSPLGPELARAVSTSLLKTEQIQLLHLVLPAHHDQPTHQVKGECTLHCLEGEVEVVTPGDTLRLRQGCLVVLPAQQPHSLRARTRAAVLVTLLMQGRGNVADAGGTDDDAASGAALT